MVFQTVKNIENPKDSQEILFLYRNLQESLGYFDIQTGSKLLRTVVFSPAEVLDGDLPA